MIKFNSKGAPTLCNCKLVLFWDNNFTITVSYNLFSTAEPVWSNFSYFGREQ